VADLSLDKVMLQDVIKKMKPVKQQEVMTYLMGHYAVSQRGPAGSCAPRGRWSTTGVARTR
jgi:hypothetical protein